MLKKLLVSLLSALLCISVVAEPEIQSDVNQNVNNITIDENGNVFVSPLKYHISSDSTAEVKKDYSYKKLESVVIPSEIRIGGHVYSVTSIGDYEFCWCDRLTHIEIPSRVTSIGNGPFSWCAGLTSINVATDNAIYSSENGVLYDKNRTKLICVPGGKKGKFVVPSGVTSIEYGAFRGCDGLTSIEIPSSVTSIGNEAFKGCNGLTSIKIPSGVTSIGNGAFEDCRGLTNIEIPSSVISIGNETFKGCAGLTSINVATDNSFYTSENGVLYDKNKTEFICVPGAMSGKFVVPSGVTSIGYGAFWGCSGLTSIKIPSSVTSIGDYAFYRCKGLTSIKIPSGVTSIGYEAFSGCSGLTSIKIPSGVTSIEDGVFYECNSLANIEIPSGVTSIGAYVFSGCSGLTNIKIPSGVTSIDNYLFPNCRGLKSIKIPSSVTYIGNGEFSDCGNLKNIEVESGNSVYSSENGILYDKNKTKLICVPRGKTGKLVIPSGVTKIGDYAFYRCKGLTNIKIPSGVTSIGDYAFFIATA